MHRHQLDQTVAFANFANAPGLDFLTRAQNAVCFVCLIFVC
jgi:hypothetical protein